jgi:TonB family protein
MRFIVGLLCAWLITAGIALSQITEVPSALTNELPMYRPILIGQGPMSLINRIDTEELMKNGQKDGLVRFVCAVRKTGEVEWSLAFGGGPGSEALKAELEKRLSAASDPRFIPAVYNHHPVDAIYYGTVTFAVVNGKPRLRIFSNQEPLEVLQESDFIGPQPFFGGESKFNGFHYPGDVARVAVDGVVKVRTKIDAAGNIQGLQVVSEEPPFVGFRDAALNDLRNAKFIPAFRNGQPVACDVTLPVLYKAKTF